MHEIIHRKFTINSVEELRYDHVICDPPYSARVHKNWKGLLASPKASSISSHLHLA